MKYYERIRTMREELGLTQEDIAARIGTCQRTYSDYERGATRIPVERLILLARFYDVSMDYICAVTDIRRGFPK